MRELYLKHTPSGFATVPSANTPWTICIRQIPLGVPNSRVLDYVRTSVPSAVGTAIMTYGDLVLLAKGPKA